MKRVTLTIASLSFLFTIGMLISSCSGNKNSEQQPTEEVKQEPSTSAEDATAYACPMHPEVTGKKGDTCSKCGMPLELVTESDAPDTTHHK